jgi:hypothetical protein
MAPQRSAAELKVPETGPPASTSTVPGTEGPLPQRLLYREAFDHTLPATTAISEDELMAAVGAREETSGSVAQAQAQRQRNFTLFSRSYTQVRRAIGFLRWEHEDVDQICPSLFAGRGGSRRKDAAPRTPSEADSGTHPVAHAMPTDTTVGKAPSAIAVALSGENPIGEKAS